MAVAIERCFSHLGRYTRPARTPARCEPGRRGWAQPVVASYKGPRSPWPPMLGPAYDADQPYPLKTDPVPSGRTRTTRTEVAAMTSTIHVGFQARARVRSDGRARPELRGRIEDHRAILEQPVTGLRPRIARIGCARAVQGRMVGRQGKPATRHPDRSSICRRPPQVFPRSTPGAGPRRARGAAKQTDRATAG